VILVLLLGCVARIAVTSEPPGALISVPGGESSLAPT
jgi:hypothetical protein